jgi:alkylation response protein AidB-like acyl-CoA dehydrogenase
VVESALRLAREVGHLDDPRVRDLVGEAHMLNRVSMATLERLSAGIRVGALPDQSASIGRLLTGTFGARSTDIAYELAEADAVAWSDDDGPIEGLGVDQLMRQVGSIGGGTTEMARNVIAERVLGMPRERRMDKGVAFRDVPRGSA